MEPRESVSLEPSHEILDLSHLSEEVKGDLLEILRPRRSLRDELLGEISGATHRIDTGDAAPVRIQAYRERSVPQ